MVVNLVDLVVIDLEAIVLAVEDFIAFVVEDFINFEVEDFFALALACFLVNLIDLIPLMAKGFLEGFLEIDC